MTSKKTTVEQIGSIVEGLESPDVVEISKKATAKTKPKTKRPTTRRKPASKAKASTTTEAPTPKRTAKRDLKSRLEESFSLLGVLSYAFDPFDGQMILENSGRLAESLTNLAKANPAVRKALEAALAVGAWGEVFSVLIGGILGPILVHHRLLPDGINANLATALSIPLKDVPETDHATA